MAARSIGSLTVSFGLVAIPVKLYSATETSQAIHFNMLHKGCGSRLKQQYLCAREDIPVSRADTVKGYEFAKDQYVMFTPEEIKALEEAGSHAAEITEFVPIEAIDPVYFDKAYYIAPDKGGAKPYALLHKALRESSRCAIGIWAARGKQYIVMIRPVKEGLIMQQLLYANEIRSVSELDIPKMDVKDSELKLAQMLIEQQSSDTFDPTAYKDEVRERMMAAIEKKIDGQEITSSAESDEGARVIDLMEALRASLEKRGGAASSKKPAAKTKAAAGPAAEVEPEPLRKPPKRAGSTTRSTPARKTAKK